MKSNSFDVYYEITIGSKKPEKKLQLITQIGTETLMQSDPDDLPFEPYNPSSGLRL